MNLRLVSNLRAVVTTFQWSCLLSVDRCRITFAFELILFKVGVLYTPDCELTRAQIDCMLTVVGACDFLWCHFIFTFHFI